MRQFDNRQANSPEAIFGISFTLYVDHARENALFARRATLTPRTHTDTDTGVAPNGRLCVCACAQFNRGDQVDQLAEAGSLGWMLGWSVALRVSTPGSPTFLSHHRRPAALFRSFHTIPSPVGRSAVLLPPATSIRDANPPYRVPSLPLPLCARLYFSLCLSLSLLLYLSDPRRSPSRFLSLSLSFYPSSSPSSLFHPPSFSHSLSLSLLRLSRVSSSSQRHQLSSTPPATPNCSRVSNRGASRVTLQVADRFATTFGSDCSGRRRAAV